VELLILLSYINLLEIAEFCSSFLMSGAFNFLLWWIVEGLAGIALVQLVLADKQLFIVLTMPPQSSKIKITRLNLLF
jgi:hypothetical protein